MAIGPQQLPILSPGHLRRTSLTGRTNKSLTSRSEPWAKDFFPAPFRTSGRAHSWTEGEPSGERRSNTAQRGFPRSLSASASPWFSVGDRQSLDTGQWWIVNTHTVTHTRPARKGRLPSPFLFLSFSLHLHVLHFLGLPSFLAHPPIHFYYRALDTVICDPRLLFHVVFSTVYPWECVLAVRPHSVPWPELPNLKRGPVSLVHFAAQNSPTRPSTFILNLCQTQRT